MSWSVERALGPASTFHARALPDPLTRAVWVHQIDRPALVLGSAQSPDIVDSAAATTAGVEIVRRRSGGGAVLLIPGEVLWVDVTLPADDPLWVDDIGRSFHWLGEAWAAAVDPVGRSAEVHTGPLLRTQWSALVCFAGLGPGEVSLGGRKFVGLSQRRTRAGARFQCALHRRFDAATLADLLRLSDDEREQLVAEVSLIVAVTDRPLDDVLAAFLRAL